MTKQLQAAFRGKRVLITGHTGFKGSWLTRWLLQLGAEVHGYSLPEPVSSPDLFGILGLTNYCNDIRGDIRDRDALARALAQARPDIIFHFAGQALVRFSHIEPLATFEINAQGTANLLQSARNHATIQALVIATSDKVYRNTGGEQAFTETAALGGDDPYSASKAAAEMAVAAFRVFADLPPTTTVRAGNVIGGGDWNQDRLIPDIVRALSVGQDVPVRNPPMVRPWQHVLDCLHGYLQVGKALLNDPSGVAPSYNIGPDTEILLCVGEVTDLAIAAWGQGRWVDTHHLESRAPVEASYIALDCSAIRHDLGWQPVYDDNTAITKTITWYRANHSTSDGEKLLVRQIADFTERANANANPH